MKVTSLFIVLLVVMCGSVFGDNFRDLFSGATGGHYIYTVNGGGLKYEDSVSGLVSPVTSDGTWQVLLLSQKEIVGYADDIDYDSGNLRGQIFPPDAVIDELWLVHDSAGVDGIGSFLGDTWTLGADDVFYAYDFLGGIWDCSQNILFNGVRGDLSSMPVYSEGSPLPLPEMTVSVVPEPATLFLLGLGSLSLLRRKK